MARRHDEIPKEVLLASRGGTGKYPWDEWLDGGAWELAVGQDFTVKPQSFISTAHTQANKRGLKLRATFHKETSTVWIEARKRLPGRKKPEG